MCEHKIENTVLLMKKQDVDSDGAVAVRCCRSNISYYHCSNRRLSFPQGVFRQIALGIPLRLASEKPQLKALLSVCCRSVEIVEQGYFYTP